MLAAIADWLTIRSEVISALILLAITSPWWRRVIGAVNGSTMNLCRATRRNTRAIGRLQAVVAKNTSDVEKNGIENAFILDQNRLLLDHFDVAYAHTDTAGNVLDVSEAWCVLSGWPRDKALHDGWINAIATRDQNRVVSEFYAKVKEGRPFSIEFMFAKTFNVCRARIDPLKREKKVVGYRGVNTLLYHDVEAAKKG